MDLTNIFESERLRLTEIDPKVDAEKDSLWSHTIEYARNRKTNPVRPISALESKKNLEEELKEVIAKGAECLIIDMEETVYICSVGLRVLLATQKTIRNSGNEMKIIHVLPQIMENFEMTGFSGIMTIE